MIKGTSVTEEQFLDAWAEMEKPSEEVEDFRAWLQNNRSTHASFANPCSAYEQWSRQYRQVS